MVSRFERDSAGRPVFAFRAGPSARIPSQKHNASPEHALQVAIVSYLKHALPPGYLWTADAAGVRVSMHVASKMKAAGVRRGWPDLRILFPSGVTRFIEVKAGQGLSPEQREFRDFCAATGRDIWALAKSVEDVEAALLRWRIQPLCSIERANRYA